MTLNSREVRSQSGDAIDDRQKVKDLTEPWPWHTQLQVEKDPSGGIPVSKSNSSSSQDSSVLQRFGNMFDLKMRTFQKKLLSRQDTLDLVERIDAMKNREETSYTCRDYLHRRSLRQKESWRCELESKNDMSTFTTGCRRKMAEWSYHVIDFYRADRSIVANAFSILDRFLDNCDCDRTVFKLAAITSLYIASKSYTQRHLSLAMLVELSSGDFDEDNYTKMESIILDMIEWRVNAPTAGDFINHLVCLIPVEDETILREVSARAHFFAELSLLDYYFVPERASSVALASILNSIEGLQLSSHTSEGLREGFLLKTEQVASMDYLCHAQSYDTMQERLWNLYRSTEQCKVHDENPQLDMDNKLPQYDRMTQRKNSSNVSPVSVHIDSVDLTHTFST